MTNAPIYKIPVIQPSELKRRSLRVLLVEDSPLQSVWLSHVLRQLGHVVQVTSDGFGALSSLELDGGFDVIMMDCQLQLMNGFQATKFIRAKEQITGKRIAIVGISATASQEECLASGMDEFMSKPLKRLDISASLERAMNKNLIALMRSPVRSIT